MVFKGKNDHIFFVGNLSSYKLVMGTNPSTNPTMKETHTLPRLRGAVGVAK
jgi:hypothetical protein